MIMMYLFIAVCMYRIIHACNLYQQAAISSFDLELQPLLCTILLESYICTGVNASALE